MTGPFSGARGELIRPNERRHSHAVAYSIVGGQDIAWELGGAGGRDEREQESDWAVNAHGASTAWKSTMMWVRGW
jgi:hypothetical protein